MSSQPSGWVFEMNLQDRYVLLLASARKDIEVRVLYPKLQALGPGDSIRFRCEQESSLTRVRRVSIYKSFEQLLDAEDPVRIDLDASPPRKLANLRHIYSPEKESPGVVAIFPRRSACRRSRLAGNRLRAVRGWPRTCCQVPSTSAALASPKDRTW